MTEVSTLRDFVEERMRLLGLNQVGLAARAGLTKADVNALLQGRVKLPGPDKRRGLAAALGVSHLELLVRAGEITEEEVTRAGAAGVGSTSTGGNCGPGTNGAGAGVSTRVGIRSGRTGSRSRTTRRSAILSRVRTA